MIYSLRFVYEDQKDVILQIAESKIEDLFKCLNNNNMYFDESNRGFWTNLDRIRYIHAHPILDKNSSESIYRDSE